MSHSFRHWFGSSTGHRLNSSVRTAFLFIVGALALVISVNYVFGREPLVLRASSSHVRGGDEGGNGGMQMLQHDGRQVESHKAVLVSEELRRTIKEEVRAEILAAMAEEEKKRRQEAPHARPGTHGDGERTVSRQEQLGQLYPPTATLSEGQRRRILVTGGAGFVGSHLVDRLMAEGHEVIVVDNMFTGRKKNVAHWIGHPHFMLIVHDVVEPILLEVDQIYHLACPASPPHYQYNPIKTIKTSTMGTLNMLGLAKRVRARMLLTSTSEVYGDPQIHPQPESYWGNVNPIGPRACYDEGKRVAETMMYAYRSQGGEGDSSMEVRVARIFNTFGPRMHPNDGRVVSNFIIQALQGKNITIYGKGRQTRSFQYVDDLVSGLMKLMNSDYELPVNLGNPDEYSVKDFALLVRELVRNTDSQIVHLPATKDDPAKRKPDITIAKKELGWEPTVSVRDGLAKTIEYFRKELEETGEITPTGPEAARPQPHVEESNRS